MILNNQAKNSGFTLIEILISLAIFAALSIMFFKVNDQVRTSTKATEEKSQRLREVQFAFRQLEDDIRHMVIRERRNEYGDKEALLIGESSASESYFEFTRAGWRNPAKLARSNLQHVRYNYIENKLERLHWLYLDPALENQELERVLLTDIEEFRIEFLKEDDWKDDWLEQEDNLTMPAAIRLTVDLKDLGEIVRLFPMASFDDPSENGKSQP